MDYWQVYQRNLGIFSSQEQKALAEAKVFVAGAGGVGGIEAATLARFGLGKMVLMDPGIFDEPDMNRQFGAMQSTLGRNKAAITAKILKDINPFLELTVLENAPQDQEELRSHMQGCALVIDAIDYVGFGYKAMFARLARELGLYNMTAPIPGFSTWMTIFAPDGMTLEDFFMAPADKSLWTGYKLPLDRLLGNKRYGGQVCDFLAGRTDYLATCAGAAALNGGLVATEAALIITKRRRKDEIVTAPKVSFIDIFSRIFEVYDAHEEAGI